MSSHDIARRPRRAYFAAVVLAAAAMIGIVVYLCNSDDVVPRPDPVKVVEDGFRLRDLLPGGDDPRFSGEAP